MSTTFDFIVIGAGPGGEAAAHKARELGATVAVIDRRWFGGSCPFIGCLPSKALLHGAAEHHANPAAYPWPRASAHRDYMVNRDPDAAAPSDAGHVGSLERAGATVFPGEARITGRGEVHVRHDEHPPRPHRDERHRRGRLELPTAPHPGHRGHRGLDERAGHARLASCRAACSSWVAARPAASSPRSMPGSGSRPRSSSPARACHPPITRAIPRSSGPTLEADGVIVRTDARAVRARAGAGCRWCPRRRARRRAAGRGPCPHGGDRARGPARGARPRALRARRQRPDAAVPARRSTAHRRRPVRDRRRRPGPSCTRIRRTTRARSRSGWPSARTSHPTTGPSPGRPTWTPRRPSSG